MPAFRLAFFLVFALQSNDAAPGVLKNAVQLNDSAGDPLWLNLLQYDVSRVSLRSDVLPGNFFLTDNGHQDPEAELLAFIDAVYAPVPDDPNTHAICRFPARVLYLRRVLDVNDLPELSCPDYDAWSGYGRITGATLIFASGSLGDPATFYGHILLKFTSNATFSGNVARQTGQGNLLDTSLNYGAVFPQNENAAVYVVKGLLGGYSSTYTNVEYYEQRGDYVQSQDRDLWEYELNLTPDELELLVASSWELYQQKNTYYFLSKNCAYRFAELVALAIGQDIDFQGKPWSLPLDVFVDLSTMRGSNGQPLIANVERVHAPTTRFLSAYKALDSKQQAALESSVRSALDASQPYVPAPYFGRSDVSDKDRAEVVEAALLYITMIRAQDDDGDATEDLTNLDGAFLVQRIELPAGDTGIGLSDDTRPPHEGHRTSTAQITYLNNNRLGGGIELRLRPVLTDFLSLSAGEAPFSELSMGDLSLILRDGNARLQVFDALRITAISPRKTRLPYEYRPSWRLRFGAESESLAKDGNVVALVEGGYGHAFAPTTNTVLYGMVEGRLDTGRDTVRAGFSVGAIAQIDDRVQMMLSARRLAPVPDYDRPTLQSDLALRLGKRRDSDFRLISRFDSNTVSGRTMEWGLTYSLHF
ncbi:DUF4105 domain-containing protein [Roseobacter sp. HKCCD7415]|uniref:Lnb N-terminal periplasmic domain-containing protein n=1 Tax=unclassified Roseobacter TaxID=196798 RepID=UPI00149143CD|nr:MULTISPECIES: DUF4105 domain-containing protein [unclassified Roseobacter]NNV87765.1 DUF4105 domain-containing protein [Roseobacter sp. HKCCD8414]NNW64187.1 DUF4105 domain-containing protein [Roseobacter sp. HKCCD8268]NNX24074.1 DUF4105 domain-containing protein [Roseobacter sp. HKCCD8626]NNX92182.1 DUF4105 domain-containing protein [Roseobacter sp. HKCCD9056]NNY17749.1 DUF4105 domain-containing protein [Roseobacter sp. HKCCD8191]NNY60404.1 DUF4105 domain-containing protein [Roseobacter sp